MTLATEYAKRVKKPIIEVIITRFDGVIPGVDAEGDDYTVEIVSCDLTAGFDQQVSSCSLIIKSPTDEGDIITFQPMDRVLITQGWNTEDLPTFLGFVDTVEIENGIESVQKLECRDILKLAQNNYYVYEDRKVYYRWESEDGPGWIYENVPKDINWAILYTFDVEALVAVESWGSVEVSLTKNGVDVAHWLGVYDGPGAPVGGVQTPVLADNWWSLDKPPTPGRTYCKCFLYIDDINAPTPLDLVKLRVTYTPRAGLYPDDSNRQAEKIIEDFLVESGIPTTHQHLEVTNITIGNNNPAVFEYESAMDAINRICELIGYKVWASPAGIVVLKMARPVAAENAAYIYSAQISDYLEDGEFDITEPGNISAAQATVDDENLRNWVKIIGYNDDITSTVLGDSPYVPDPPQYRKVEIRSTLLDTKDMVQTIAERVYADLNRLDSRARVGIDGDPRVQIGQTIGITIDGVIQTNYFLFAYSSRYSTRGYFTDLDLVGAGEGEAIGNISPVALFTFEVT